MRPFFHTAVHPAHLPTAEQRVQQDAQSDQNQQSAQNNDQCLPHGQDVQLGEEDQRTAAQTQCPEPRPRIAEQEIDGRYDQEQGAPAGEEQREVFPRQE